MTTREILIELALDLQRRAMALQAEAMVAAVRAGAVSAAVDYGTPEQMERVMADYIAEGTLVVVEPSGEQPS